MSFISRRLLRCLNKFKELEQTNDTVHVDVSSIAFREEYKIEESYKINEFLDTKCKCS